tara:strand:+ start:238 stop:549 length:312 start_codon:yes stop_codon:yes gene_type:complete
MCGGGRRAHHRKEEAKRQAGIEATAARMAMEAASKRNEAMVEALKPEPEKYTPPPTTTNAMLGVRGIKPKRGTKAGTLGARRGIASLRIPLNIGQSGGTNIPS